MVRRYNHKLNIYYEEFEKFPKVCDLIEFLNERPYYIQFWFYKSERYLQYLEFPDFTTEDNNEPFEFAFDSHCFIKINNCLKLIDKDYKKANLEIPDIGIAFFSKTRIRLIRVVKRDYFKEKTTTNWFTDFVKRLNFGKVK